METIKRKPVAPFYAVAAVWLTYALLFPLYEPMHYVLLAAISAAVFFLVNVICKGGGSIGGNTEQAAAKTEEKSKEESTGNPELDKMLKDGRLAVTEMKRLDDNIADPGISADIVRLEQVSQKIFDEVRRDPKKLPQIRKFMDYYLPTTLKLLNSYDRMSAAGISGENIDATLAKVEGMMRTIVAAFEKQLDSLYGAEALDISTDITVLENMMAREGLTGNPLKAETTPKEDPDIKLEL
ncbi:5-bromo-4-chloroindolyl phosphate hydrolysis protein [Oscillibacter sp. PC13]|uniref:5-bromo-4-chloroindolyl phosphate hydrolysis family protein n=1 Tax=Oscillibacter sp. PC13 TaxID=1855299 RepID=UPI0008F0F263|nr:5-bromo-4-chloroindolyl phosphate hydrolysis family protein [Oscillibacter sp. PC13]SFP35757.1 5-bromo-4-chloroindolyl phosphate hydrolysis protein [Oscillibacter sp. PC13]